MNIIETSSLDQPGLEPYKTLRRPLDHHRRGIFVAEGEKVVRRLLASRLNVVSVLLTPEWLDELRPLLEATTAEIFVAPKSMVETIVGFHLHQGIMAVGRIPGASDLGALLHTAPRPSLLAAVDGLTNAENLGVLVRNCAAFGVHALLVGETSSSPFLRRAVRNSMGAVFRLPVVHLLNLTDTLGDLQQRQFHVLAAHPEGSRLLSDWSEDITAGICVVFGSEGEGISRQVLNACNETLAIPMQQGVDSLNVASASAVFLHELRKKLRSPI